MGQINLVEKVTILMGILSRSESELSIREIQELSGIPRSTVHRILSILEKQGWVTQNQESERYNISLRFLFMYRSTSFNRQIVEATTPIMQALANASQFTAHISVPEGRKGCCIFVQEPQSSLRRLSEIDISFPLYANARGKILLAYASKDIQEQVFSGEKKKFAPNTITDEQALRKEIENVRRAGYARSTDELVEGSSEIGVPLFNARGHFIAEFGITGPSDGFADNEDALLMKVRTSAQIYMQMMDKFPY